jgi:hypothetical protein
MSDNDPPGYEADTPPRYSCLFNEEGVEGVFMETNVDYVVNMNHQFTGYHDSLMLPGYEQHAAFNNVTVNVIVQQPRATVLSSVAEAENYNYANCCIYTCCCCWAVEFVGKITFVTISAAVWTCIIASFCGTVCCCCVTLCDETLEEEFFGIPFKVYNKLSKSCSICMKLRNASLPITDAE